MFKHYFELIDNVSVWPIVSLTIFFGFFVFLILWLIRVDKGYIKKMKNLPLNDNPTASRVVKSVLGLLLVFGTPSQIWAQNASRFGS